MKRAIIAGTAIAVAIATAGGGVVAFRGHLHSTGASDVALVSPAAAQASSEPIYYQDPDGRPFYALTPRKTQDGRDYRAVPAGADVSFDDEPVAAVAPATTADRRIKYYRNPMGLADTSPVPKKDPMGMDYIPVYEGEDQGAPGTVKVSASDGAKIKAAIDWIRSITSEPEVGQIYEGKVVKVVDFGAFVNFFGAKDGLVHVSQIARDRVNKVSDVLQEGQAVKVKLLGFDDRGKIRLSMKVVDQETGEDLTSKQETAEA